MNGTTRAVLRGTPIVAASIGATVGTYGLTDGLRHPAAAAYGDLLVALAAWTLVVGAGWAAVVCSAAVLEAASSGRLALTSCLGCSGRARRPLLAGLGVVLAGGGALAAGPVSAVPAPYDSGRSGQDGGPGLALPVPARPTGAAYAGPRRHVVRPGESLWRLCQQRAPTAAAHVVGRLVENTYLANRRVIGPDPDLIHPGQRLVLPRRRHPANPPHPDPERETP